MPSERISAPGQIKFDAELKREVNEWRRLQADLPPLAEAVRRLVRIGLETSGQIKPKGRAAA